MTIVFNSMRFNFKGGFMTDIKVAVYPCGLTQEEQAVFEWQYGMCGDFKRALWKAICQADDENKGRLARAFPVEVKGYLRYAYESGWWQRVEEKAIHLGYVKGVPK